MVVLLETLKNAALLIHSVNPVAEESNFDVLHPLMKICTKE